jgi:hypothetical protein
MTRTILMRDDRRWTAACDFSRCMCLISELPFLAEEESITSCIRSLSLRLTRLASTTYSHTCLSSDTPQLWTEMTTCAMELGRYFYLCEYSDEVEQNVFLMARNAYRILLDELGIGDTERFSAKIA